MNTAPDWITAIATVGALVAASIAGVTTRNLYRIERVRDRIAKDERDRRIADHVHAWTAAVLEDGETRYGLQITNRSTVPVFDLTILSNTGIKISGGGREPAKPVTVALLPPGGYFVQTIPASRQHDVSNGIPIPLDVLRGEVRPVMRDREWVVTELSFTDASGRRWTRKREGTLHEEGEASPE